MLLIRQFYQVFIREMGLQSIDSQQQYFEETFNKLEMHGLLCVGTGLAECSFLVAILARQL